VSPADRVVVDTGVLLAAADADDRWHRQASAILYERSAGQLILPVPVAVEAAWLIASRLGPATEGVFVASLAAGDFTLADLSGPDWARCAQLVVDYADMGLGLVDASVVALAERLRITTVASIDRRDLLVVRPAHCEAFNLIP
jgi:predicted nucleic acid-binding protein